MSISQSRTLAAMHDGLLPKLIGGSYRSLKRGNENA